MGIIQAIIDDAKRQYKEMGARETEEKIKEERKTTIQSLQNEGFSDEKIATIMGLSIEEIIGLMNQK